MEHALLTVNRLKTYFYTEDGVVPAVDDVSFAIKKGEVVAIVGESGSGKSVTSLSVMRLIENPGKIAGGEILFEGRNLVDISLKKMRELRGNQLAMIFQEPLTSLNPVFTIGNQLAESIRLHQKKNKKEAIKIGIEMLEKVGIARANQVYDQYPHALSGGMQQRVMIAMALSCNPKLLIADEPTTALDVTIQAQILRLMKDLIEEFGTSILLITHDLGVVAEMADQVIVMYGGQVVEQADVFTLFKEPKHPYTKGLIDSTPKIHEWKEELNSIPGTVPGPFEFPEGCKFADRCPFVMDKCKAESPPVIEIGKGHVVRCWLHGEKGLKLNESKSFT
ncbi:ABC transporter ATP-binding protein [Oceanobacillus alkalisoli]|uniref:ABC transporter ATP-binding protein n=1 Tax=Oceanobacillus alkalisoli TaxID=2925113 RepID=UPI001F11E167|nr:ABC transporter ATP-binding protein [Oceanobacillus alkalisoli]MCF3944580.1 ABC transporter ATP-binding protein [Oceanobacillus alkalisoli]